MSATIFLNHQNILNILQLSKMKIINGFVSNSSSSAFVLPLRKLSLEQLCKIVNHLEWGAKLGITVWEQSDSWDIDIRNGILYGSTSMDNFNMKEFLEKIGVPDTVWNECDGKPCNMDMECDHCTVRFMCYTNK